MIVLPEVVQVVSQILKENENCFLVGGAVRDIVLGRQIQDYDFATDIDPRRLARKVADKLDGAFFVMDDKRFTSRVILPQVDQFRIVMDFSALQGTLENDLHQRDFTINSMAIDIRNPNGIIDPMKGGRDLQEKWLRPCKPSSFLDDPVRVIRAVRYATELGLRIESPTTSLIIKSIEVLDQVSQERKRDELFKILDIPRSYKAILILQKFGILSSLSLEPTPEYLGGLRTYELIQEMLFPVGKRTGTHHLVTASILSAMVPIKAKLLTFMSARNSNGHSRFQLNKFVLLTNKESLANEPASEFLHVYPNEEIDFIHLFHDFGKNVLTMLTGVDEISNREAYRLFRDVEDSGIDLILLALAEIASKPAAELDQENWLRTVNKAARLCEIWFEYPKISQPTPLLNGNEIMSELSLQPGPVVGQLLASLKEEQAAGKIGDRKNALVWLKQKYRQTIENS